MTDPIETRLEPCHSCQVPAEILIAYVGKDNDAVRVCNRCASLLTAAEVLWTSDVADENEIITTLAFAQSSSTSIMASEADSRTRCKRLELVRVIEGVPIVRLRPVAATTLRYSTGQLPRLIRMEVLSKFAEPSEVAERYWEIIAHEGLPVFSNSPGSIAWEYKDARLIVTVGPREEIEPSRLASFEEYPHYYRFSFPMPSVVEAVCKALLGEPKRKGTKGDELFAAGLGDHGRNSGKQPHTLIPACIAWHAGERDRKARPKDRRPRIAKLVNRTLLEPLAKAQVVDNPYSSADPLWRDAEVSGPRFDRARLLIQDDERDAFMQVLRKAPI